MRRRDDGNRGKSPPSGGVPRSAQDGNSGPLDRWWVQVLVSAWMLFVVVTYFRLQLTRLLEIAGR
ncbi:MAG: hypothetical protein ABSD48_01790 [Armatimonadota bacterium]